MHLKKKTFEILNYVRCSYIHFGIDAFNNFSNVIPPKMTLSSNSNYLALGLCLFSGKLCK